MSNDVIKLRRYENDLYVSGTGVIILGAWGVLKALMEILLGPENYLDIDINDPVLKPFVFAFSIIFVLAFMTLIMMMHLYVGINAAKAAKGMDHKKGYIAAAVIMLMFTLIGFAAYSDNDPNDIDTTIASFFVDLTTLYVFAAVILSSYRIKKLKAQQVRE